MGLLSNLADKAKKGIETSREESQRRAECYKDRTINLNVTFGSRESGIPPLAVMRQKLDGTTYFSYQDTVTYRIVGYEWDGPMYDSVTTASTQEQTSSEATKKGKAGKMTAGALVGTALMPGVGTVVGAAIGAGGKGMERTTGSQQSNTHQVNRQAEKNTTAILKLRRTSDNVVFPITVTCNSNIDAQLRCFVIDTETTMAAASQDATDALKGIKALKELLDMGAITADEFEAKKKQLLSL